MHQSELQKRTLQTKIPFQCALRSRHLSTHTKAIIQVTKQLPLLQNAPSPVQAVRDGGRLQRPQGLTSELPTFCLSRVKRQTGLAYKGITLKNRNWRKDISSIQRLGWVFSMTQSRLSPFCIILILLCCRNPASSAVPGRCRCCTASLILPFKQREEAFFKFLSYLSLICWTFRARSG